MLKKRTKGAMRDLTYKYNQFVSEEIDRRKSQHDSQGEIIDKINGKKYFISFNILLYLFHYSFVKKDSKDLDSDSTADSNRPSYMDKFESYNKIITDLEAKCKLLFI